MVFGTICGSVIMLFFVPREYCEIYGVDLFSRYLRVHSLHGNFG